MLRRRHGRHNVSSFAFDGTGLGKLGLFVGGARIVDLVVLIVALPFEVATTKEK